MNGEAPYTTETFRPSTEAAPPDRGAPPIGADASHPRPRFRTLQEFCAEYVPIAYVVEGLLCSGSVYTLTAKTGVGKTALMLSTALAIVTGRAEIIGRSVNQGRVAFCTAENPDGVRMRFAVACFHWNVDQAAIARDCLISDNRVRPEEICAYLTEEATNGPFRAIFIDTWQAFFDGKDANHPTEAVAFTRRFRSLTRLPGNPAVVIAAHPTKNAANDQLIPYGGDSTLNEVDGNLALTPQTTGYIELNWQGKFRGLGFNPPLYRIDHFTSPDIKDAHGREVETPVILIASSEDAEAREKQTSDLQLRLMRALAEKPGASLADLGATIGVNKQRAGRLLTRANKAKPSLARQSAGKWLLTAAGKKTLKELSGEADDRPRKSSARDPDEGND
jgi:hypothetical protein